MAGPMQVVNATNLIACTGCPIPHPLIVSSQFVASNSTQLCATIADCEPMVNILPFGPCALMQAKLSSPVPVPCVPQPIGMWAPGSPITKISGVPALRNSDTLQCAQGGTIMIMQPGQFIESVT